MSIQVKTCLKKKLIDDLESAVEFIQSIMKPKNEDTKNYGEVPTPFFIVKEMLNSLDEFCPEIWNDSSIKWLFPCVGMGNFPIIIFQKLMENLSIENELERKKHILEKMFYFCEKQDKSVHILKLIFDIENEFDLNIYHGDFLLCKKNIPFAKKSGNTIYINDFDICVENPPYNDDSGNKGKSHILWPKILTKSLNLIKENGYILFIHPGSWRKLDSEVGRELREKQLLKLRMRGVNEGLKIFKKNTDCDWYLLKNCPVHKNTIVIDYEGIEQEIDLRKLPFIPNFMISKIMEIISEDGEKTDVNYYRSAYGADKEWVSKTKNSEFKYPVIYQINNGDELILNWSKTNQNGHFGIKKFIFSNGIGTFCDYEGEYGLTQWAYAIYDNPENFSKIKECFMNPDFQKIISAIKLDSSKYYIPAMKLFKKDFYLNYSLKKNKPDLISNEKTSLIIKQDNQKKSTVTKVSEDIPVIDVKDKKKKSSVKKIT